MIRGGLRRFDLYDFFSVFLPGATFIIGLFPFLPVDTEFGVSLVGATVVLGFVVGRAVHGIAISFDNYWENKGHREEFLEQLAEPDVLPANVIDRFFDVCCEVYTDLDLCEDRTTSVESDDDELEPLYTLVRSYIHMDSRGRSRTFQAVYAFYRSMWLVSLLLAFVYYVYSFARLLGVTTGAVDYYTYASSLGIPTAAIMGLSVSVGLFAYRVFRDAKTRHQRYYVQYLISDFITLYEASSRLDSGDPTAPARPPRQRDDRN
ncbi:hypothetical protein RYH80_13145 [Halobaculum sp. MBLA0147]|uniref:hypothetical protein n=1 Tax=Halobaculum sp. MBLA0147 TaxID=3079934 RepID=UPI0035250F19